MTKTVLAQLAHYALLLPFLSLRKITNYFSEGEKRRPEIPLRFAGYFFYRKFNFIVRVILVLGLVETYLSSSSCSFSSP